MTHILHRMLAASLTRCTKAIRLGANIHMLRIAGEIVPAVLHRPVLVKIGLTTSFMAVCDVKARCMEEMYKQNLYT